MMKPIKYLFLSIVIAISVISCSDNASNTIIEEEPLESLPYAEYLNVAYGVDSNQTFDIYLPENRTIETKVMILIHGGAWVSGDKADMNPFKDMIQQDLPNIAVVNINYRLADETHNPYPMQIDDITDVVNFLQSHQDEYTISNELGLVGVSAGAHLSMLWSYAFDTNDVVKMVCSIVGPTNFTDPVYLNSDDPVLQDIIELYGIDTSIEYLEEVSPYHQATTSAPPSILFYGGQDPLVPVSQGADMKDKLDQLGVVNQYTLYPNAGHGWDGADLIDSQTKLILFTQTHLE